jgi:hypothetical protein
VNWVSYAWATGAPTGIELRPPCLRERIRNATKADARARFRVAIAESLALQTGRFDWGFSTLMLHHLSRKEDLPAVRKSSCDGREGRSSRGGSRLGLPEALKRR